MEGKTKCYNHGGATPVRNGKSSSYVKRAGLSDVGSNDPHLQEEIALVRGLLGKACDSLKQASEIADVEIRAALMGKASVMCLHFTEHVRRLLETEARVRTLTGDMLTTDAAKLLIYSALEIIEDEIGKEASKRVVQRMRSSLPIAGNSEYLLQRRLEVVYPDGDDSIELSPDPNIPSLPSSQEHLASEIPGACVRPEAGENPLGSGKNGT